MNFEQSLQILGIEKYSERIFHSNSHGELFHLLDYINMANNLKKYKKKYGNTGWFAEWFDSVVEVAEEKWERPESVFQHIEKILSTCNDKPKT